MLLLGCVGVGTTYTPSKAEYARGLKPTVQLATLAYEGDLPTLVSAGAVVLGQMDGSGNGFAAHADVLRTVRKDAARKGATHVVFVAAHDEEDRTPVAFSTQCGKGGCITSQLGGYRFYRPHATYVLMRVPQRNIRQLPRSLGGDGRPPPKSTVSVSSGIGGSIERARLRKRRAIEQARRHCYERARAELADTLSADDEQRLDAAATAEIDGRAIRAATSTTSSSTEELALDAEGRQNEVLEWYEKCVIVEVAELEGISNARSTGASKLTAP